MRRAKAKLLGKLEQAVMERFEGVQGEDPSDTLDAIEFYETALLDIRNRYVTCFPPEWHIMDFYLSAYHRGICKVLAAIAIDPAQCRQRCHPQRTRISPKHQPPATDLHSPQLCPTFARHALDQTLHRIFVPIRGDTGQFVPKDT